MEFYYKNGETMDIGFIGFGKVNQTLANKLTKQYKTYVSIENRSEETIKRIKQTETIKLDSNKQLMEELAFINNKDKMNQSTKRSKTIFKLKDYT